MADKFYGDVVAGAASVSVEVILLSTADSSPVINAAFGSVTAFYYRQGAASPIQITPVSLAAPNSAYSVGGWVQIHAANYPGRYRFDVPDAMFASGADWVGLSIRFTGALNFDPHFGIQSPALIADQYLLRDWSLITATVPPRCALNAMRFIRNRWGIVGTSLSVKKEDDTTEAWNAQVETSAGATPVVGVDPT
jgi:hypothetical protein